MLTVHGSREHEFDNNVQQELRFEAADYEFVNHESPITTASDSAREITNHQYNKLLRQTSEPYKVLSTQSHSKSNQKNHLQGAASIDCITLSHTQAKGADVSFKARQTRQALNLNEQQWKTVEKENKSTKDNTPVPGEYVVAQLVHPMNTPQGIKIFGSMVQISARGMIFCNHYSTSLRNLLDDILIYQQVNANAQAANRQGMTTGLLETVLAGGQ